MYLALVGLLAFAVPTPSQQASGAFREVPSLDPRGSFGGTVAQQSLGQALAASGDTAVLGAVESVRILERQGLSWTSGPELFATTLDPGPAFGSAVAIDGDTIAVGAPLEDGEQRFAGAVRLFERDLGGAGAWGQRIRLARVPVGPRERMGIALALEGDTLVVAVPGAPAGGLLLGFGRDAGGPDAWGLVQQLATPGAPGSRELGASLALDGDLLAASLLDLAGGVPTGAVALYRRVGGTWQNEALLAPSSPEPLFARSLALDGERLALGIPGRGDDPAAGGEVELRERDAGGAGSWGVRARLAPSDLSPGDTFGWSVSLQGDLLAVGAPGATPSPTQVSQQGALYLFGAARSGAWRLLERQASPVAIPLTLPPELRYGSAVVIEGDCLFASAPLAPQSARGRVWVWGLESVLLPR